MNAATRNLIGKHSLQFYGNHGVVCSLNVDAGNGIPRLLGSLRVVIIGRVVLKALCPGVSLFIGKVAVECRLRILDPQIITLKDICQHPTEKLGTTLT